MTTAEVIADRIERATDAIHAEQTLKQLTCVTIKNFTTVNTIINKVNVKMKMLGITNYSLKVVNNIDGTYSINPVNIYKRNRSRYAID